MGKIYMHIGTPKTGSSAIQAFLTLNYTLLKNKGFHFPNPPDIENAQAFQTTSGNGNFILSLLEKGNQDKLEEYFFKMMNMDENIIISSESITSAYYKYFEDMMHLINKFNIITIVYIRKQDDYLISAYNQGVKNHGFYKNFELQSNFHSTYKTIDKLINNVDKDNLIIRPYEKQQFKGGNIYSDFLDTIGLEYTNKYNLPDAVVNPSLSLDAMEYKKTINSIKEYGGINLSAERVLINSYILDYVVNEKKEGKAFENQNIISRQDRLKILKIYEELNVKIAKDFLNRKDGKLFLNEIPENYEELSKDVTITDYVNIAEYMLNKKEPNNLEKNLEFLERGIKKYIAKFTVDKILGAVEDENNICYGVEKLKLLYSLDEIQKKFSNQIEIEKYENNKFYIKSTGNDPYFILPNFKNTKHKKLVIKISIESKIHSFLEIFYASNNQKFNKSRVKKINIDNESNVYHIAIQNDEIINRIRFDIGNQTGEYIINSIEIYNS